MRRLPATARPGRPVVAVPFRTDRSMMNCIAPHQIFWGYTGGLYDRRPGTIGRHRRRLIVPAA